MMEYFGKKIYEKIKNLTPKKKTISLGVGLAMITFATIGADVNNNRRIAEAMDLENDDYYLSMPIETENGIELIPKDSIVIVNSNTLGWEKTDQLLSISAISENGELVTGEVSSKYLKKIGKIPEKKLKEYTKFYRVVGDNIVFEIDPKLGEVEGNTISNISENMQVFGSDNKVITGEANWYGIMYIDEDGELQEAYGKQQNLVEYSKNNETQIFENDSLMNANEEKENISNIKMIVNSLDSVVTEINLRSEQSTWEDSDIITTIPNGAIVYAIDDIIEQSDGVNWRKISYKNPDNDQEFIGWCSNDLLKEYDIVKKIVNTDTVGGITLKLKDKPYGEIIDEIENGATINISLTDYCEMIQTDDGTNWIKVELDNNKSGYVSYDYLENGETDIIPQMPTEDTKNKALSNYNLSKNGEVIGIDISESMSVSQLEELLESSKAIGDEVTSEFYTEPADTSDISGKINYVYIKIGASDFEDGSIYKQVNPTLYIEQARMCENYGVPYGFYYYSTCIDEQEAKVEADYINSCISLVENRKYNLLPVAIDVEKVSSTSDRQLIPIEDDGEIVGYKDLTDVKISLLKKVSEKQGTVLLYGQGDLISDNSFTQIVKIDRLKRELGDKFAGVWLPTQIDGEIDKYSPQVQSYINDFNPQMQQIILDATNLIADVDINKINEQNYNTLICNQFKAQNSLENKEKGVFLETETERDGLD